MPVAHCFLPTDGTPVKLAKGGTSDAELVIDFLNSWADRCTSWFYGLGWCRNSHRMDLVRSVRGAIPYQPGP